MTRGGEEEDNHSKELEDAREGGGHRSSNEAPAKGVDEHVVDDDVEEVGKRRNPDTGGEDMLRLDRRQSGGSGSEEVERGRGRREERRRGEEVFRWRGSTCRYLVKTMYKILGSIPGSR